MQDFYQAGIMARQNKKREQKPKKKRRILGPTTSFLFILISALLLLGIYSDVSTTHMLQEEIAENEIIRNEVKAQKENLSTQKERLSNPDYIEYLARGKYLVTKYGEQVFKFPSIEKENEKAKQELSSQEQAADGSSS